MRGVARNVSPSTGLRFVCYCKDCQAFARFLDRADVLDPAGGTDNFHMAPGRVKLTANSIAFRYLSSGWRCRFPLRLYDALAAQRLFKPFERCCRNQFAARVAWS
jgi:hypothetical protein